MSSTPLEIQIDGTPDEPVLVLRGEIDLSSVVGLRTAVDELPRARADQLMIDLAEVSFMDSTGLGWMAGLARSGCMVTLRRTPPAIRKLLEVTGIDGVVTVLPDV
jgi:anti-sigma B factor antagonist